MSIEASDGVPVSGDAAVEVGSGNGSRLRRRLSAFDTFLLTLSSSSPVFSVYGPGSDVLQHTGTGAVVVFLLAIGAAAIWGLVYAELGAAYPYAGGDYVGVGSILGSAAGFVCLMLWAAVVLPLTAVLAELFATYVAQVTPLPPGGATVLGALALACVLALLTVRTSAKVTGLFLMIELIAVLALAVPGFLHPFGGFATMLAHPRVPDATGHWLPVSSVALAMGAISAAYATLGGNQAIVFGEELVDARRNMGRVILAASLIGAIAVALPVIAVAWYAAGHPAIISSPAPLSAFVSSMGGPMAGRALSAAVALAVFNAMIAQLLFAGRLLFSFARDGIFPARTNAALASVHGRSGAPRIATIAVAAASALCCLCSEHVLVVFIAGLVVYAFGLVSAAVLLGRPRRQTGGPGFWRSPCYPLVPLLGIALAVIFAAADWADRDAGRPSLLTLGALLLLALAWYYFVLRRRPGGWSPRLAHSEARE